MKREREHLPTYTYASGPMISSATPVTTKTMVRLIDALKHHFGPGYEFAPEPISEGGIQMIHWPEQTDEPRGTFKTFRFHMDSSQRWPWIGPETLSEWRDGRDEIIWDVRATPLKGSLFFKAFYGAPCWTQESIALIVKSLTEVGFKCAKKGMPTKRALVSNGEDCGGPRYAAQ